MSAESIRYREVFSDDEWHSYRVVDELFRNRSQYQEIAIYDLAVLGRTLVLDSKIQAAEVDEYIYHEMLVHPGLLLHEGPKRVFIAGGGDGATVREVLRHKCVFDVTMIEIDKMVVEASSTHLSSFHRGAFEDPRLTLRYDDARAYLETSADEYDAIILDISDPDELAPSRKLFTKEFYALCRSRLRSGGVLVVQGDFVGIDEKHLFVRIASTLVSVFEQVFPYWAHIPSFHYPWGFFVCTLSTSDKFVYVGDEEIKRRIDGDLHYYYSETHDMSNLFSRSIRQKLSASTDTLITDDEPLFGV